MREARLERSRRRLADHVRERGVDPDSAAGRRLVSLRLLTSGALALVELHDRQGLAVDDAIEASLWAADVLIEASRSETGSQHQREARP